jgi:hypothetical protein
MTATAGSEIDGEVESFYYAVSDITMEMNSFSLGIRLG